jgi:hypothetical protein
MLVLGLFGPQVRMKLETNITSISHDLANCVSRCTNRVQVPRSTDVSEYRRLFTACQSSEVPNALATVRRADVHETTCWLLGVVFGMSENEFCHCA